MAKTIDQVKAVYDLGVTTNALTMASALALILAGAFTGEMYDTIGTFEPDEEENKKYADSANSLAMASYWIGMLVFFALAVLIGYKTGKGKDALAQKDTKAATYAQQAFSFIAVVMLIATSGMGIHMYNSVATWGITTPTTAAATVSSNAMMMPSRRNNKKKSRAETTTEEEGKTDADKAKSYNSLLISFIVLASIALAVWLAYLVKDAELMTKFKASYGGVKGGYTPRPYAAAFTSVAARPTAFNTAPAVSEFFTY